MEMIQHCNICGDEFVYKTLERTEDGMWKPYGEHVWKHHHGSKGTSFDMWLQE